MKKKDLGSRRGTPLAFISADKELIELAREIGGFDLLGVFETNPQEDRLGLPFLGNDDDIPALRKEHRGAQFVIGMDRGGIKAALVKELGPKALATLISRDAYISPSARVADGSWIQRGVKIMSCARIGTACKVNVNALVHHNCVVGDCCALAPGAMLLGSVTVGDRVFIGAGAIILPKLTIGSDAVIGAGAVVTKSVPPGATVAGVPARLLGRKVV